MAGQGAKVPTRAQHCRRALGWWGTPPGLMEPLNQGEEGQLRPQPARSPARFCPELQHHPHPLPCRARSGRGPSPPAAGVRPPHWFRPLDFAVVVF